jgi:hypothetical protein
MSFKVRNSQLSNEALQSLNNLIEQDINASVAFKIMKVVKFISSIVESKVEAEKKIFEKWTRKDQNGEVERPKDDEGNIINDAVMITDVDAFSKEMSDLLNIENEIPFDKINFEELQLKTIKIKDLAKIEFLFED